MSAVDWYMEHVLFLPLELAQGRNAAVKTLALIVYLPWFFVFGAIGLPMMFIEAVVEMWSSLR